MSYTSINLINNHIPYINCSYNFIMTMSTPSTFVFYSRCL